MICDRREDGSDIRALVRDSKRLIRPGSRCYITVCVDLPPAPMTEQPFKISIQDDELDLLKAKLELAVLPDELDDAGWAYGVPLVDLKRLVAHWKTGYDWRKHERLLNEELPQFTRDVDVVLS